jgi:hypothetical protein
MSQIRWDLQNSPGSVGCLSWYYSSYIFLVYDCPNILTFAFIRLQKRIAYELNFGIKNSPLGVPVISCNFHGQWLSCCRQVPRKVHIQHGGSSGQTATRIHISRISFLLSCGDKPRWFSDIDDTTALGVKLTVIVSQVG